MTPATKVCVKNKLAMKKCTLTDYNKPHDLQLPIGVLYFRVV